MPEYGDHRSAIEREYARPLPKVTIGSWLNERLEEKFGRGAFPVAAVGQVVDTDLHRPSALRPPSPPRRILVVGVYEAWEKGIATALEAVERMRAEGFALRLIRVSSFPLTAAERDRFRPDAYYHCLPPARLAEEYRRAHIFLAPSRAAEGFGLPFVEALATGLPAVATAIPSHLSFDRKHDYACFVSEGDPVALAAGLRQLLDDGNRCLALSRRAVEVVRNRFQADAVAARLESCFQCWLNGRGNE
jgi:glycosyltransferase involved in cell wall biosynthesis